MKRSCSLLATAIIALYIIFFLLFGYSQVASITTISLAAVFLIAIFVLIRYYYRSSQ